MTENEEMLNWFVNLKTKTNHFTTSSINVFATTNERYRIVEVQNNTRCAISTPTAITLVSCSPSHDLVIVFVVRETYVLFDSVCVCETISSFTNID